MTPRNAAYLAMGTFLGVGIVFYQVDAPKSDQCQTYRVARKSVVSYALKPPPSPPPDPIIIKEKCPVVESQKQADEKADNIEPSTEETPRRRIHRRWRHYRRVRAYWK